VPETSHNVNLKLEIFLFPKTKYHRIGYLPPVTESKEYVNADESSDACTVKTLVPTASFSFTAVPAGAVVHAGFSSFTFPTCTFKEI